MYHLDNTSGVPEMPEPKEQQSISPRWFGESLEHGGISWPGADWFNTVQAEMLNLIAAAGLKPDKKSYDQLSQAIPILGDAGLRKEIDKKLVSIYVDSLGADPSGEEDSSPAFFKAIAIISTLMDSAYRYGSTRFYEIVSGAGSYIVGDIPIPAGTPLRGQGMFATRFIPKEGAKFVFDSVGTSDYYENRVDGARLMSPALSDFCIGDYQEPLQEYAKGCGGIRLAYCSYPLLKHILINRVHGCALRLEQCWDAKPLDIRIMESGNADDPDNVVPGLYIGAGVSAGDDGSNAIHFYGLQIENCAKLFEIDRYSRHIFVHGGKLENVVSPVPSTVRGTYSVMFNNVEMTTAFAHVPMVQLDDAEFTRINEDGTEERVLVENRMTVFNSPAFISPESGSRKGNYIENLGTGELQVNSLSASYAARLVSGDNIKVMGGSALKSGPLHVLGGKNVIVSGLTIRDPLPGDSPYIAVTGLGCHVSRNDIECSGTLDDGGCAVQVGPEATDAHVTFNSLSGTRQAGVRLLNAVCQKHVYENNVINSGSFGNVVTGGKALHVVTSAGNSLMGQGGVFSMAPTTIANGATGETAVYGGSDMTIRVLYNGKYATAKIFADNTSSTLVLMASIGGVFATGSGVENDGKVYLSTSGGVLRMKNFTGFSGIFYGTGMCALLE